MKASALHSMIQNKDDKNGDNDDDETTMMMIMIKTMNGMGDIKWIPYKIKVMI